MTTPVMGVDRFAAVTALALLDRLALELAHTRGGPPARVGLYPGEEIAPMDECCAGQAAVRVYRIFGMTGRFPQQNHGPKNCSELQSYGVTLEMTVYRCASTLRSDGSPPDTDDLLDDTLVQLDDAAAMRRAIRATAVYLGTQPFSGVELFVEDDYNPVGPAGDCVGGRQRCTFGVYDQL